MTGDESRPGSVGQAVRSPAGQEQAGQPVRYDTDAGLLAQVLQVYRPHCRYMRTAVVTRTPQPDEPDRITVSGDFAIGESCYIDDTGHFNAVEFNICYNQMAYYLIAKAIKEGLHEVFDGWALDDFWRLQLPKIVITDYRSSFKRQMGRDHFSGEASVVDVVRLERSERWDPLVVIRTRCGFWDDTGGSCRGEVKIAIRDPV